MGSLAPFLDPASVAVIGASRDPYKVGGSVERIASGRTSFGRASLAST